MGWSWCVGAQTCSWGRCLEPMPFPAGEEGDTVARRPGSDCSGRPGYESSDSKPAVGDESNYCSDMMKEWKEKDGRRQDTCFVPSGSQRSVWTSPVTELICRPGNRRFRMRLYLYSKYWFTVCITTKYVKKGNWIYTLRLNAQIRHFDTLIFCQCQVKSPFI